MISEKRKDVIFALPKERDVWIVFDENIEDEDDEYEPWGPFPVVAVAITYSEIKQKQSQLEFFVLWPDGFENDSAEIAWIDRKNTFFTEEAARDHIASVRARQVRIASGHAIAGVDTE
jgi:hypothetical protein